MAVETPVFRKSDAAAIIPWRSLIVAVLALAVGWGGIVYAANNSVQGAKKEEGGFDGDAPTAILIEASSGSVLFEKNADELRAPSSMMKLMTVEVVFNALKEGKVKLSDEYRISENAWRKGGAPAGGSTMFAILNSKVSVDDLLHGAIIQSGNDSCIALAEGMAGNERIFAADFLTKRARELGMTKSTFGNSSGLPDPANKMTVRELSKLARHLILTYPDMYKLFGEKEFIWNKIRQQNRNPLLNSLNGADGLKTGYTKEGGYGMVGSAVQNDTRLIVVVNGLRWNAEASDPGEDIGAEHRRVPGDRRPPIMADNDGLLFAERRHQRNHVADIVKEGIGADIGRRAGPAEPPHIRGDDTEAGLCDRGNLVPPGVG